ncbi:MAG: hypothetical protein HQL58_04020 [Magnetococcales bacterium]|nr:hypothetical protein [Magnetococcales bacterium]
MIVKILLVFLLLVGIYALGRYHRHRQEAVFSTTPSGLILEQGQSSWLPARNWLVTIFLFLTLAGALLAWWLWQDGQQMMHLRIIDIRTGAEVHYQAQKRHIFLRSFITPDGRRVTLSDLERMEVAPEQP